MLVSLSPDMALHAWDGEVVAYDRLSGDTRLLDHMATSVVELLLMRAQNPDDVLAILRQQEADVPVDEWRAEFEACLANLLTLGVLRAE